MPMTSYCPDCGMGWGAHYVDCPRSPHHWPKSATRRHIDPAPTDENSSESISSSETDRSVATVEYREVGCGSHAWCVEQDGERIATFDLAGGKKKAERVANAINRAERRSSPEPSAEAVEAVAEVQITEDEVLIEQIGPLHNGQLLYPRAALAADPLRRELPRCVYCDKPVTSGSGNWAYHQFCNEAEAQFSEAMDEERGGQCSWMEALQNYAELRREMGEAMQLLMDIKEWDVDGWKERDTLMALPLELRQRLAALLEKHA